jgi:hypothetical protein
MFIVLLSNPSLGVLRGHIWRLTGAKLRGNSCPIVTFEESSQYSRRFRSYSDGYGKPSLNVLSEQSFLGLTGRVAGTVEAAESRVRHSCNRLRQAAVEMPEIVAIARIFRLIAA